MGPLLIALGVGLVAGWIGALFYERRTTAKYLDRFLSPNGDRQ